jgi:hypothetical protein
MQFMNCFQIFKLYELLFQARSHKSRKAPISSVLSVRPSVWPHVSADSREI